MLVELKVSGTLSAKQTTVLAWWAAKAGATGPARDLGVRPDQQSGQYSSRFDRWANCGTQSLDLYDIECGRHLKFEAGRRWDTLPCRAPHEAFGEELLQNEGLVSELDAAISERRLPPCYFEHEAVRSAPGGGRLHPFCLYLDAVPYTRGESVLGVFVYFVLSQKRHLVFCIRKSEMCKCGCRGQCSLFPLFAMLSWSCKAMLSGKYPTERHDAKEWKSSDAARATWAGRDLGFRAICLFIKADWAEVVHSLGFPSWQDASSPCPFCFCSSAEMYLTRGFSPVSCPCPPKKLDDYLEACERCEVRSTLSAADLRRLRPLLAYERRAGRPRGRVLQADVPELGLLKGDRLAPTILEPDIDSFSPTLAPREAVWWRSSDETIVRDRNPLFCRESGVTLGALGIDWLHACSLGTFQFILGHLVRALLDLNAFRVRGSGANMRELGLGLLKAELTRWYGDEGRRGLHHTRIENITMGMLGGTDESAFRLHGAETNGALRFAHAVLVPKYGMILGTREEPFRQAIATSVQMMDLIREHPVCFPPADIQTFCDAVIGHLRALRVLETGFKPKHHFLVEMGARPNHVCDTEHGRTE